MKHIAIVLLTILLSFLSSCGVISNPSIETADADEIVQNMLTAIEKEDDASLKGFFSENVQNMESFEDMVTNLTEFYKGTMVSISGVKGSTSMKKADGNKRYVTSFSYVIQTTETTYHLAFCICTVDTFDSKNVGIDSLSIITAEDWEKYCEKYCDGWAVRYIVPPNSSTGIFIEDESH